MIGVRLISGCGKELVDILTINGKGVPAALAIEGERGGGGNKCTCSL